MNKEMLRALEADGEKLRQLTGEDHGPWPADPPRRCDNCLHFMIEPARSHDDPYGERTVCGLHIVAGGWHRMAVDPDAVCSEHRWDDGSDDGPREPEISVEQLAALLMEF